MKNALIKYLRIDQIPVRWQLNAIGLFLLALLGLSAWQITRFPFTVATFLPLTFIAYAAIRITYELTFNRANVPTIATSYKGRGIVTEILKKGAAQSTTHPYKIIDLGSGRGELTRRIACAVPDAEVVGIEMARFPCAQASMVQRLFGPRNLSYQCLDFWSYDCATVDAVVFYLTPALAQRVGEKLHKELKPGSVVISHSFPLLDDWVPSETVPYLTPFKEILYVYRKA